MSDQIKSPVEAATDLEIAMDLLDPDTREILLRDRAELKLHTAMACVALARTVELDREVSRAIAQALNAHLSLLPHDQHRRVNSYLTGVVTELAVSTQQSVFVETGVDAVDTSSLRGADPIGPMVQSGVSATQAVETPDSPSEVTEPETHSTDTETGEVSGVAPADNTRSLLDRALERLPEVVTRLAATPPSQNGNTAPVAAELVSQEAAQVPQPEVSRPAVDVFAKLGLKEYDTIPRPMREFIERVMPKGVAGQTEALTQRGASLVAYMLISDYLVHGVHTRISDESRRLNTILLTRFVGLKERPHSMADLGRARNITGQSVSYRLEGAQKALYAHLPQERRQQILEAGLQETVVPDLLQKVLGEGALAAKK